MTTSDKTELKPCPFCGSKPMFGSSLGYIFVSCPECLAGNSLAMDSFKGQKEDAIEHWNRRSEPCKPSETPMSKEEPMKPTQEKLWCAMCGTWGDHQSGTCPELHPKPSPMDKAYENFVKQKGVYWVPEDELSWKAGWQASRKECEEEMDILEMNYDTARNREERLKDRVAKGEVENEHLKQELIDLKKTIDEHVTKCAEDRAASVLKIVSLQSVVEAKDEEYKSFVARTARAALHIDQSAVKPPEAKE